MSYDLRFAVKAENGQYVVFKEPELSSPTYNLGDMFRACTGWDYTQGEYYKVSDIIGYIANGIKELQINRKKYEQYVPSNGWGSMSGARECLESIMKAINDIEDYMDIPLDIVYMAW